MVEVDESPKPASDRDDVAELAQEIKELAKRRHRRVTTHAERSELAARLPLLSKLASTSGTDQRSKAEVIEKAVIAAVARVASQSTAGRQGEVDEAEVKQLQCLLGLTPETRWLPWGKRQQAAAAVRHQALDTFRKQPQERLFHLIAMNLLRDGSATTSNRSAVENPDELTVFSGQQALHPWLIPYIWSARPATAHMILVSGAATQPVLTALRDVGCEIELLLCHPEEAVTEWQKRHIKTSVDDMHSIGFQEYDKLAIRFYRTPASLHGWRIGEYVGLSWYTYRDDPSLDLDDPGQRGVFGHDNIGMVGNVQSEPGRQVSNWLEREFNHLQNHRKTKPDEALFPVRPL